jgi:hypothetical protein
MTDDPRKLLEEARKYISAVGVPLYKTNQLETKRQILARIDRCLATGGWIDGEPPLPKKG